MSDDERTRRADAICEAWAALNRDNFRFGVAVGIGVMIVLWMILDLIK